MIQVRCPYCGFTKGYGTKAPTTHCPKLRGNDWYPSDYCPFQFVDPLDAARAEAGLLQVELRSATAKEG